MAPPDFYSLPDLVDQIETLCKAGRSGTVLLISDDNRMAQVHLHQGQVVYVLCRGRRGRDALQIMRTMQTARMTLDTTVETRTGGTGFSTAMVLGYLRGSISDLPEDMESGPATVTAGQQQAAAVREAPRAPVREAPREVPRAPARDAGVSQAAKQVLQSTMLRYIGPMAEIVCGEHFAGASNLRDLAIALAAEIPGATQRAEFKSKIAESLGLAPL